MGVETRTYDIPDLVLSDTFYEWFTVTNDQIIAKLNLLEIYTLGGVSISGQGTVVGDGISAGLGSGGELFIEVGSTIDKDVTFNGNITVNGSTTTINSTNFSVDDYNLILGATTEQVGDHEIMDSSGGASGGGIIVKGSSGDKEFLWKYSNAAWNSNQNIKLAANKSLLDEVRIAKGASGGNATKGLVFGFTAGTTGGVSGSDALITIFNNDITAGHSADVMSINDDGQVSINKGVNKITVNQNAHGFTFGNPVYLATTGLYTKAIANNLTKAEVIGLVSRVYDANKFEITTNGVIKGDFSSVTVGSTSIQSGQAYFLDTATSGKITTDKTTTDGHVQKTVLLGITSDEGLVVQFVGGEVDKILTTENATNSNRILVNQPGHGFTFGDVVYRSAVTDGALYKRGAPTADEAAGAAGTLSESPSEIIGICDNPTVGGNSDVFSLVLSGKFGMTTGAPALVPGQTYFIQKGTVSDNERNVDYIPFGDSAQTALGLALGDIIKPCFVATDTHEGIITNLIGTELSTDEISDTFDDVPVGTIISAAGTLNDGNYLECNGQFVTESDYPELYPILTSPVEDDGGIPSKRVPDLNGRFLIGDGEGTDINGVDKSFTVGTTGGEYDIVLDETNIPEHQHESPYVYDHNVGNGGSNPETDGNPLFAGRLDANDPSGNLPAPGAAGFVSGVKTGQVDAFHAASAGTDFRNFGPGHPSTDVRMNTTAYGDSDPQHNNIPPYYAVKYYIRAKGVTVLEDGTRITGGDIEHVPCTAGRRGYVSNDPVYGNIEITDTSLEGDEREFDFVIADSVPEGTNIGLIRSVTVQFAADMDQSNGRIEYYFESLGRYQAVYRADDLGDHHITVITLPVSPGQTTLRFLGNVNDIQLTGTNGDALSIRPLSFSATVDNSINRIQKSYTRKNLLINGNFDLWQRGLGTASAYTGSAAGHFYVPDRWAIRSSVTTGASGNYSVERKSFDLSQSTVPHNPRYYTEVKARTVSNVLNQEYFSFEQKIPNVTTLAGKNMTVSFWAKGSTPGTCFLGYNRYYGGEESPGARDPHSISTFSVNTDWKKYSFTVFVPNIPAGKTEDFDREGFANSYLGLSYYLTLKNGTHALNASADVNYTGTLSIAQVQVEEGGRNTLFELRDQSEELELAQAFYEKSYFPHIAPGTDTRKGTGDEAVMRSQTASAWETGPGVDGNTTTERASRDFEFVTTKRGAANMKVYTPAGVEDTLSQMNKNLVLGTDVTVVYNNDGSDTFSIESVDPKVSMTGISDRKFRGVFYTTNSGTGIRLGVDFFFEWTADAELDFYTDPS